MPSVIAIVGRSKSGKTTLIEKLIPEMVRRGYTVGTIKNTFHSVDFDKPGSDTWRHIKAGSQATVLNSKDSVFMVRQKKSEYGLKDILKWFGSGFHLILLEGFKESDVPKIMVYNKQKPLPLTDLSNVKAVISEETLDIDIPQYKPHDITGIADLLAGLTVKLPRP